MFDLGMMELVVIFVVALLAFGPKRLPDIAKSIGRGIAEMKNAMEGVKARIDSEMRDVKEGMEGVKSRIDSEIRDVKDGIGKDDAFMSEGRNSPTDDPRTPTGRSGPVDGEAGPKDKEKV
jgi:Tat protein translocase TatB subunit